MVENKKQRVFHITQDFPYGHLEDSFVGPEYPYLCECFDISIIAAEVPPDTELLSEEEVKNKGFEARIISNRQKITEKLFSLCCFLLTKDCYTEIISIIRSGKKIFRRIYRALMFGAAAETFYRRLKQSISLTRDTQALFYFYWWDYKCHGLTMHKKKHPNIKIVTRTHNYDLYDEREVYGRQFYKTQMDKKLDRIMFVSVYGKEYYLNKYGKIDSIKYPVHYLGVSDPGPPERKEKGKDIQIVSCSALIPLKRVELIIDGLSRVQDIPVHWIHMGDGIELERLQKMAEEKLKGNIQYDFRGRVSNRQVLEYYRNNNVTCFITTTSIEGNPVSVQEALSFGLPIIATCVSDIPHMIDGNGVLLSENPTGDEVAGAIRTIVNMTEDKYKDLCRNSYRIFCRDYDVNTNHRKLAEDLAGIK